MSFFTESTSTVNANLMNLGINKISGTETIWFKTTTTGITRHIIANEAKNFELINLAILNNDKLAVTVNNGGTVESVLTSTELIEKDKWYFGALRWSLSGSILTIDAFLNGKKYTVTTNSYLDFTTGDTALGTSIHGRDALNGYLTNFTYSNRALSDSEILKLYQEGKGNTVSYVYDELGRLTTQSITHGETEVNKTSYTYAPGGYGSNSTTTLIDSISTGNYSFTYDYNNSGNIETTTENGQTITYHYNELNELVREDNEVLNKTIVYDYDVGGNILSKTEYPYTIGTLVTATKTINYNYTDANWKDKLTSYDGKEITYDEIGNPLTYDNYTYSWEAGNQLAGITGNGITTSYKYNDSGIRTEKTVGNVTTKYRLEGSRVTYETNGTDEIYYTYDDTLISMNLNGEEYFYVYNLQGDVVGLLDSTGTEVVTYQYDTWGNEVSISGTKASTVGEKNPYRYRGYRYDSETKLYYLNARYYNPEWGRFLNADTFRGLTGDLLSHNAFAYAKNNPVMYVDPTGYFWKSIVKKVKKAVKKTADVLILDDLKTLADGKLDGNDVIALMNLTPWGKAVKVAGLAVKAGIGIKAAMASSTAMSSMGIVGKASKGKIKTYEQARNESLSWLEKRGFKPEKQTPGKFGYTKDKPIGMQTNDGKVGFRVEYESRSGAHINVWAGKEKGPHFKFDATERTVKKLQKIFDFR